MVKKSGSAACPCACPKKRMKRRAVRRAKAIPRPLPAPGILQPQVQASQLQMPVKREVEKMTMGTQTETPKSTASVQVQTEMSVPKKKTLIARRPRRTKEEIAFARAMEAAKSINELPKGQTSIREFM